MVLLMKLGYRNLWRNRRRTLLTMSAMGTATALLVLTLGIYDGMLWDMIEGATELYHGHVKITAVDYLDERKLDQVISGEGWTSAFSGDPLVKGVAGRVRGFALLSAGEGEGSHTQPAELLGIDLDEERGVSRMHECVVGGTFLTNGSNHDIVIGAGLARLLEAEVGCEIVAMGQGADRSIAADIFTLAGIIDTGDPVRDAMLAVVGRETLQEMLVLEGRFHEVAVSLKKPLKAQEWAELHGGLYPDTEITAWNDFLPMMGSIIELWDVFEMIFALIFYFAVILVTVNTMYMALLERMREFGIITALGMKLRRLSLLIVLEGFMMSAIAGCTGGIVGYGLSSILSVHHIDLSAYMSQISYGGTAIQPQIRCYMSLDNTLMPVAVIISLGVLISLFPAFKLKKLKPVEALKEV